MLGRNHTAIATTHFYNQQCIFGKLQSLAVAPGTQSPTEAAAMLATLGRARALAHASYSLQALVERMAIQQWVPRRYSTGSPLGALW